MTTMVIWIMVLWIPPIIPAQSDPDPAAAASSAEPAASISLPAIARTPGAQDQEVVAAEPARPAAPAAPASQSLLGLTWTVLEDALASHLGIAPEEGRIVTAVEPRSPAARSGLRPFDILVEMDGEALRPDLLPVRLRGRTRTKLGILRRGEFMHVEFYSNEASAPAEAAEEEPDGFFARDDLAKDHPFRRLRALRSSEQRYDQRLRLTNDQLRETREEVQKLRDLAQKERQELRRRYTEQVKAAISDLGTRAQAWLETELHGFDNDYFGQFVIEREAVQPEGGTKALQNSLGPLEQRLQGDLPKDVLRQAEAVRALDSKLSKAFVSDYQRMRQEVLSSEQRSLRPHLNRLAESWERHRGFFGKPLAGRFESPRQLVESIHAKARERLKCALERGENSITKQLEERLADYDVPEPGVIEFALEELEDELHRHIERVLARMLPALQQFEARLSEQNEQLQPALLTEWERWDAEVTQLVEQFDAALVEEPRDWPADEQRLEAALHERLQGIERGLDASMRHSREGLRCVLRETEDLLHQHRRTTEFALEDLELDLREVLSKLSRHCWKLREPCMDESILEEILERQRSARPVRKISYRES
jgi:uncharacterized protein YicC (UPF0701 family)